MPDSHGKKHEVYLQHMIVTELATLIVDLKKLLPTH